MTPPLSRILYLVLGGSLVLATWAPAFAAPHEDDYPFSTYPMFASKRKAPRLAKAEAKQEDGTWINVQPELLGSGEVMQAAATVKRAARSKKRATHLCRSIVRAGGDDFREVRIVRVRYDPIEYFVDGPKPISRKTIARCGPDVSARKRQRLRGKSKKTRAQRAKGGAR